jgi:hypothetical protein
MERGAPSVFYHGTSVEAALAIQDEGFNVDLSGKNAGALLGPGVYCSTVLRKALGYASKAGRSSREFSQGCVMELQIDLGRCKQLTRNQKDWAEEGYDSAWAPDGANGDPNSFSENVVRDPARITIVGMIPGDSSELFRAGLVVSAAGRLVKDSADVLTRQMQRMAISPDRPAGRSEPLPQLPDLTLSIPKIEVHLGNLDAGQLRSLRKQEVDGKNRKGLLQKLDRLLK